MEGQSQNNFTITCLNRLQKTDVTYDRIAQLSTFFVSKQLLHPNLIRYFGLVCDDCQAVVITEKMELTTLRKYLLSSPTRMVPENEVRGIFRGLLAGLEQLHSCGFAHTKIHLDNIFYDPSRSIVKLGDFAICENTPLLMRQDGDDMHPYIFIAPEVWFNVERGAELRTDLWSLGVVLYTLVNGHYPFFANTKPELFKEIMKGPTKFHPLLSPQCVSLILSLLQLSPDERISLEDLKNHEWMTMGNNTPVRLSAIQPPPVSFSSSPLSSPYGSPQVDEFGQKRRGSWTTNENAEEDFNAHRVKRRNTVANIDEVRFAAQKMVIPTSITQSLNAAAPVNEQEIQEEKQKWIERIRSAPPTKASDFAERRKDCGTNKLPINIQSLLPAYLTSQNGLTSASSQPSPRPTTPPAINLNAFIQSFNQAHQLAQEEPTNQTTPPPPSTKFVESPKSNVVQSVLPSQPPVDVNNNNDSTNNNHLNVAVNNNSNNNDNDGLVPFALPSTNTIDQLLSQTQSISQLAQTPSLSQLGTALSGNISLSNIDLSQFNLSLPSFSQATLSSLFKETDSLFA